MKTIIFILLLSEMIFLTFGEVLICSSIDQRPPIYSVYKIWDNYIIENSLTSNPDSLLKANFIDYKKIDGSIKFIINRIK
jgi:hypothetical protein